MDNIFYLDGLFRSGNTVLSSILNQNPQVCSTSLSPIGDYFFSLSEANRWSEGALRNNNKQQFSNMIKSIIPEYYKDVEQNHLIVRAKHWTMPLNFQFIKENINPSPKIIYTVRDTLDILASMVLLLRKNPYLNEAMLRSNFQAIHYLEPEDARCDFIMDSQGLLMSSFYGLYNAIQPENIPHVHFVHYDDLINYPQETMNRVYTFLEIDSYEHDFNNIIKKESEEEPFNLPNQLHEVRINLSKISPHYSEVLSPYVINKYSGADFWKHSVPRITKG
jgi:hypothetical protein